MSQPLRTKNLSAASLRRPKPARTVLLRMAADESRAKRIRALKEAHPTVRWREIAAYVGVAERSAHSWAATGAIAPENAVKLTEFFRELGDNLSDDYIWRGHREATPNLMDMLGSGSDQPNIIEELLRKILSRLDELAPLADRVGELEKDLELLRGQLGASDAEAMQRHEEVLRAIRRRPQQEPPQ